MDNKLIALVVAIALVAVAGAGVVLMKDNDSGDDQPDEPKGETYWYYLDFGADNQKTKWYSGNGDDANVAFEDAMKKAGIEFTWSKWGYIGTVDGIGESGWAIYMYLFHYFDASAQKASLDMGMSMSANNSSGWTMISGYDWADETCKDPKLSQFDTHVFFMSPYGGAPDYSHGAPYHNKVTEEPWMNLGPFAPDAVHEEVSETYWFYINYGIDNEKNKWYSGVGTNAALAFKNAMDTANINFVVNGAGYMGEIDGVSGMWASLYYAYDDYTAAAQNGAISNVEELMELTSNGIGLNSGYDWAEGAAGGDKIAQMGPHVFFFGMWDDFMDIPNGPIGDKSWMGQGPFEPITAVE